MLWMQTRRETGHSTRSTSEWQAIKTTYILISVTSRAGVKITEDGWEVVKRMPTRYLRPNGMLPLPVPKKGGSIKLLNNSLIVLIMSLHFSWPG